MKSVLVFVVCGEDWDREEKKSKTSGGLEKLSILLRAWWLMCCDKKHNFHHLISDIVRRERKVKSKLLSFVTSSNLFRYFRCALWRDEKKIISFLSASFLIIQMLSVFISPYNKHSSLRYIVHTATENFQKFVDEALKT
jgi:hypothetical protein